MTAEFSHFLITRFNIGFKTRYPDPEVRKKWMEGRIEVFEKITLPSVAAQSTSNFKWLIMFDPSVTEDYPEFIQRLEAIEFCQPIYLEIDRFSVGDLADVIQGMVPPDVRHVITSRLDSDDAISEDYIEEIQKHFEPNKTFIINFTDGFGYSSHGKVCTYIRNMVLFASFCECLDHGELRTVYCASHASLKRIAPVKHVTGKFMYIYYYHEDNISNNTMKMTSWSKLPLDYIARFLATNFDVFNKYLRYSYRISVSNTDPRLETFNTKL